ncbi:MAG: nucleotide exchange factor GrpE [Halanaerobium sp.]
MNKEQMENNSKNYASDEEKKEKFEEVESKKANSEEKNNEEGSRESELDLELSREELIEEVREKDNKIDALDAEVDDLLGRMQRLQADFVNYRKRSEREKEEMSLKGKIELASEILPVIDNFELALNSADNNTEFYSGVEMIYKQLLKLLSDQGIEEISAEGEEFDPEFHEAIMKVDAENEEDEGKVVEVIQKGFILDERVVRPARVKVAV